MLPATLRTARLVLRPPEAEDADWIAREIARPEVHQMLISPPRPYALSDAEAWLKTPYSKTGTYVIEAPGPVGVVAIDCDPDGNELGYWLRTDAWGKGYMTEAGLAVVGSWFAATNEDIISSHLTANAGSAGVLGKLGFQYAGPVMRHSHFWGREVELQAMLLTKARWLDHGRARAQGN